MDLYIKVDINEQDEMHINWRKLREEQGDKNKNWFQKKIEWLTGGRHLQHNKATSYLKKLQFS